MAGESDRTYVPDDSPRGRTPLGAIELRSADQDRTLAAIHQLEAALGSAAPGRETEWRSEVVGALSVLCEAMTDEDRNAEEPDSLLSDVKHNQPHLRTRVNGLRSQYRQLVDSIRILQQEIEQTADVVPEHADIRVRLGRLLDAMRYQRARESGLIYEAYYDAFHTELEHER